METFDELNGALPAGWRLLHYNPEGQHFSATHDASGALQTAPSAERLVAQCASWDQEQADRGLDHAPVSVSDGLQ